MFVESGRSKRLVALYAFHTLLVVRPPVHGQHDNQDQGGRTWQPFVGSKNGNENFRQARIYNFRDKCVVFARNRKFALLI